MWLAMKFLRHSLRVRVKNEGKNHFSLEKRKNQSLNGCPASNGETFAIWKVFEGKVMFSDIVFWGMDHHLEVSGKCFWGDILRRTLEKGVLKSNLGTEYHPWTPASRLLLCVCELCLFRHIWFFAMLWTRTRQAPLTMGFSRQEYWSGLWCPPPGGFPDPGTEPASLKSPALAGRFSATPATWKAYLAAKTLQLCLTPCDPMDCGRPGSSIHGISQARTLEPVTISFCRRSSRPRDQTCVSLTSPTLTSWFFTSNTTWEALSWYMSS